MSRSAPTTPLDRDGPTRLNGRRGITVRTLVETPHLELEVLAGSRGLNQPVAWTHVSELEDPARWLDGGELLMTNGLGIRPDRKSQVSLVARLVRRRAVGLGIGIRGPELTDEMVAEADRHGFPLLRIPLQVPFLSIAHMVADANQNAAQRRLLTHIQIFDTLRPRERPATSDEIFARLEEISGYDLYLISANGTPLLSGFRSPPEESLQVLATADFDPASGNPAVPGGYAVPVPIDRRTGTVLLALERPAGEPAGLGAVRHISTIAALELSKLYHERESRRRQTAQTLERLFEGEMDTPTVEAALSEAGFDPNRSLVVAAIRSANDSLDDDEIHHRLCDLRVPHLLLLEKDLYVVIAAESDVLPLVVGNLGVRTGVSLEHAGVNRLAIARKEASWALDRAINKASGAEAIVYFRASDTAMHWLPSDIATLENLVKQVLEPLLLYDSEKNSTMLQSLRVFFEEDRRLQHAATALHVHKHTLAYRLHRIEELTGRNLGHMPDLVQLWLALQAYDVITVTYGDGS